MSVGARGRAVVVAELLHECAGAGPESKPREEGLRVSRLPGGLRTRRSKEEIEMG